MEQEEQEPRPYQRVSWQGFFGCPLQGEPVVAKTLPHPGERVDRVMLDPVRRSWPSR